MKIRIIQDPGGDAPEWVHQAWIGMEFETDSNIDPQPTKPINVFLLKSKTKMATPIEVYLITCKEAFERLLSSSWEAYLWWYVHTDCISHPEKHLAFPAWSCQRV